MSLRTRGKTISDGEISAIGRDGFWLIYTGKEYYVPFEDYPIFRKATVEQIYSVSVISPGQLRWETLDCDIEIDALEKPEEFPLMFNP
jgi:hypothetical protein